MSLNENTRHVFLLGRMFDVIYFFSICNSTIRDEAAEP